MRAVFGFFGEVSTAFTEARVLDISFVQARRRDSTSPETVAEAARDVARSAVRDAAVLKGRL